MQSAARSIKKAKWGMFCIPGVATLDHIRLAADHGMSFLRVGTDFDKVDTSVPYIELARELGLEVFSNFMKSYVLTPEEFGKLALRASNFGSQLVYLVDSAGGMLPSEVVRYINASKDLASDVALGFHGHNNLGLAVANTLVCIENGVSMIDTTLQGFGRSAGNASTEQVISALARAGYDYCVDPIKAVELGEILIRPLIERRGLSSLDIIAGQALFHSSYMPKVLSFAKKYRIDPRALILELCKENRVDAPDATLEKLAQHLTDAWPAPHVLPRANYYGEEQENA
jgi:4-hydroxy 2-oxovalerate aldolase